MASKILTMDPNCRPGTIAYDHHTRARMMAARGGNGASNLARAVGNMLRGWEEYASAYRAAYGPESVLGEDYVLGEAWRDIGEALRVLLNGEVGGWDCGSLDGNILRCAREAGAGLEGDDDGSEVAP